MRAGDGTRAWLRSQSALARRATIPVVALGLASIVAAMMQAWSIAHLVGPVLVGRGVADAPVWAGLFATMGLLRAGLGVVADGRAFEAGAAARRRLRTSYLVAAFAAGPHRVGTLGVGAPGAEVSTAVDQVDALDAFFARWLPTAVLAWAGPLVVLLVVLADDPVAALVMLAGGLAVPVGMALAGIGAAAASQQQFAALARLQARFLDRVRGIATIVLAGQAEAEAGRLHEAASDLARRTMRVLRVAFLSSSVLDAAAATVLVVLATRAGLAWQAGTLQPITAVLAILLVSEFFAPLRAFAAAYQDRMSATAAAGTLGVLPQAQAALPAPAIRTVAASGVTVAFDRVRYAWDPARGPVLDDLSFRVSANEAAVLVGASGAGKSTVIELLLGFIQPQSGRITINGADLSTLTPSALSRMTAWIGQRPVLFAGSIRDNIRFGREDASDEAIETAARAAGLAPVIAALPGGLDTLIGEGGYGLSGGQAQRVAIGRAFLRNAPLLLLDEPTAHLDPATEADVIESLRRLALGRTVIIASHASAAMAFSGRRIVLDGGRAAAAQGAA